MAGGTANKANPLLGVAIARMADLTKHLQELQQSGNPAAHGKQAIATTALTAALAALNALV